MSNDRNDANSMLYLLAGVGLGAIIGAAAGMLFAPKAGEELRSELNDKLKEIKNKTDEWVAEHRKKAEHAATLPDELGA